MAALQAHTEVGDGLHMHRHCDNELGVDRQAANMPQFFRIAGSGVIGGYTFHLNGPMHKLATQEGLKEAISFCLLLLSFHSPVSLDR